MSSGKAVSTKRFGVVLAGVLLAVLAAEACRAAWLTEEEARYVPRARIACLPSPTLGVRYFDCDDLGPHYYQTFLGWDEHNGIVYTCRGGHVDITHVRKAADWAAYLAYHCRETLLENRTQLSFKMREVSTYHLHFQYPPGWRRLPDDERQRIAQEVAAGVGLHLGHIGSVWHEVLTWSGYRTSGVYPEFQSAFSWEDNYSNAMGAYLAGLALRDPDRSFSDAMTYYIDRELKDLIPQPKSVARQAANQVKDVWYTGGYFTCDMIKRHLDVGLDDGLVTPWLAPGAGDCDNPVSRSYPVPTLAVLGQYGFHVTVEIDVKEWEREKILRAAYPDRSERTTRIEPDKHLPAIMASIRAAAVKRYGPDVDEPGTATPPSGRSHTTARTTR